MTSTKNTPPTRPKSFGSELQRLRESAGLSLDDIIAETKISRRILEGLELGEFRRLPEQVFCRNFVRQYARIIGADEENLVSLFSAAWEAYQAVTNSNPAMVIPEPETLESVKWRFWLPVALVVLILAAVTVVVLRRSGDGQGSPNPTGAGSSQLEPLPPSSPAPAPSALESTDGSEGLLTISLRVGEGQECWVRYRDNEGSRGQQLLKDGEDLALRLAGPVVFKLGNAGAVTLNVDGTEYSSLGTSGQKILDFELDEKGTLQVHDKEVRDD